MNAFKRLIDKKKEEIKNIDKVGDVVIKIREYLRDNNIETWDNSTNSDYLDPVEEWLLDNTETILKGNAIRVKIITNEYDNIFFVSQNGSKENDAQGRRILNNVLIHFILTLGNWEYDTYELNINNEIKW